MTCFEDQGAVEDDPRTNVAQSSRTDRAVGTVESVHATSSVSTRRRTTQSPEHRILKLVLRMFSYKIRLIQELLPGNSQNANKFSPLATKNVNFLNNLIVRDEPHFYLNGYVH